MSRINNLLIFFFDIDRFAVRLEGLSFGLCLHKDLHLVQMVCRISSLSLKSKTFLGPFDWVLSHKGTIFSRQATSQKKRRCNSVSFG